MKVFIGVANTANMGFIYKKGFTQIGCQADFFERSPHPFYNNVGQKKLFPLSLLLPVYKLYHHEDINPLENEILLSTLEQFLINQMLLDYDLYIFINAETILPGNLDLPILRKHQKQVISIFSGSEVRESESASRLWNDFNINYTLPYIKTQPLNNSISLLEMMFSNIYYPSMLKKSYQILMAEFFSDAILSVPEQSALQSSPYYPYIHAVDTESITFKLPRNTKARIVHIPSNPKVKRSDIILKALEEIKSEGVKFDLTAKTRIPHSEVKSLLSNADIVIDQLNVFPALLSHESMASGCAVLTGINPLGLPIPLEEYACPAVNITESNIKEITKKIITDIDLSRALAVLGQDYIMSYCTPKKGAERLISYLERSKKRDYDYYPVYFFKHLPVINGQQRHSMIEYLLKKSLYKNGLPNANSKKKLELLGILDKPSTQEPVLWETKIDYLSENIAIKNQR